MKLLKVDSKVFDQELDLFPLYEGLKPSSMGIKKMNSYSKTQEERDKRFLFGPSFQVFRENKELCRLDNLQDYYQARRHYPEIIKNIVDTLVTENQEYFKVSYENEKIILYCKLTNEILTFDKNYYLIDQKTKLTIPFVDSMDALAMQVSEDLVIHHVPNGQLNPLKDEEEKRDYASVVHLCHCNGWEATWAIDQTFDYIHKEVPRINKIVPNASRMMLSFLNRNFSFERIAAISFKTNGILNRHEKYMNEWATPFNKEDPFMHLRVERQTVTGFKESEAFLFTIRTYLYDLNVLNSNVSKESKIKRLKSIKNVFSNPDEKSYAHDVILKYQKDVLDWVSDQEKLLK